MEKQEIRNKAIAHVQATGMTSEHSGYYGELNTYIVGYIQALRDTKQPYSIVPEPLINENK